jgi:FkbM family methyltransferase
MKVKTQKNSNGTVSINLDENTYSVPNHWFWPEFEVNWEPQTFTFFKKNLVKDTAYLDIGGWVGPTALIATELGAKKVFVVEPNPMNFINLLTTQFSNKDLLDKWTILNLCVSSSRGFLQIGPIDGIMNSSSATNIRDQKGVEVLSVLLEDILDPQSVYSLIKIDIEGAEEFIIQDLRVFFNTNAAIWLSIHPPFYQDKAGVFENLYSLNDIYHPTDENNTVISWDEVKLKIMSDDKLPEWGTKYGNFFEIGLLPKGN